MNPTIRSALVSLVLVVVQTKIADLLSVAGIAPDFLLIWIVYLAITEGQLRGTVWGFSVGLCMDLVSGNFLGLSALAKTISGFFGGYFHNENKTHLTLGSYRFLLVVLAASFIHNITYFLIFTQGADIHFWHVVFRFGLTSTLYTATITLVPMFAFSRKLSLRP